MTEKQEPRHTASHKLTSKQQHFCRCVASGMSQAAAFREAYDCRLGSKKETQQQQGSRLMAKSKVAARVKALIAQKERALQAKSLTDRDKVLDKLRLWLDGMTENIDPDTGLITTTGESGTMAQLRSAELLGKTVGMFRDVTEVRDQRSSAEIQADIDEMIDRLGGSDGGAQSKDDRPPARPAEETLQ